MSPTAHSIRDTEFVHRRISMTATVSTRAVVGAPGEWRDRESLHPAWLKNDCVVREGARVHAGCERPTIIGERTLVLSGAYVGHDTQIGADCEIAPNATIGGLCTIGERVKIGMNATILPRLTIGDGARIGAGVVVTKNVPAGETWIGNPARRLHKWSAGS